jgi:uncharacterized repeat protein (TIGR03803 family)
MLAVSEGRLTMISSHLRLCCAVSLLTIPLCLAGGAADAAKYKVIYNFGSQDHDGATPTGNLTADAAGNLYGSTYAGGNGELSGGTVFELSPSGGNWTEQLLHEFEDQSKGWGPKGALLRDASGNLYGTTCCGGQFAAGTVFTLPAGSGELDVLHDFGSGKDGREPLSGLIFGPDDLLYGTTDNGGRFSNGTAFSINPSGDGTEYGTIHSFGSVGDGGSPWYGSLIGRKTLYGTTIAGGTGYDTVYSLKPKASGWKEEVLYNFAGTGDVGTPDHGVIQDKSGVLYGCAQKGTFNQGGVYALTQTSKNIWTEAILYSFGTQTNDPVDAASCDIAMDSKGRIFGTTDDGGVNNAGTIFELDPPSGGHAGWTETVLHSFDPAAGDGRFPLSGLLQVGNTYYGTTSYGGSFGIGTVYSIKP